MKTISNTDNVIDSRDIIKRIDELTGDFQALVDDIVTRLVQARAERHRVGMCPRCDLLQSFRAMVDRVHRGDIGQ